MPGEWLNYLTRRENIVTRYYRDSIFHTMDRHRRLNKYQATMVHLQLLDTSLSILSIAVRGLGLDSLEQCACPSPANLLARLKTVFPDRVGSLQISLDHSVYLGVKW